MNGDVIVIRGGTYAGFTVQNKSLWIARLGANDVTISGIIIEDLAVERRVVLSGLNVLAGPTLPQPNALLVRADR